MPITSGLAEILIETGLITQDQLTIAQESQKNLGLRLEEVLIDKGFVTEEQLLKALAKRVKTPFVSLSKYKADPNMAELLPVHLAKKYRAIALFKVENKVTIATSNPMNLAGLDDIRDAIASDIEVVLALDSDIELAIKENYKGLELDKDETPVQVEVIASDQDPMAGATAEHLEKAASGAQVVAAVNSIIARSFEERASDIHLEPTRENLKVRFRVDGILEDFESLPKNMHLPVVARLKIIGGMDVAEKRVPQDGRVHVRVGGRELDLRLATYPTMFGEAAAVRLLSKEQLMTLEDLGFLDSDLKIFESLINKPHGIFLVTGPTGSGKTTTLYASLLRINSKEKHILSIEDPVEHEIPGVDQQQINPKTGVTFASSLRAMLRQDPDVIMVGEIRDKETAEIAIRAAMTGHLVFSTLHTNTAISAVSRLMDLGIEPYLLSSTLIGVMAQRLVRKICPKCKAPCEAATSEFHKLGLEGPISAFKGLGCKNCGKRGYFGRVGLFEVVQVTDEVKVLINNRLPEIRIEEKVASLGHHSLLADGIQKIKHGVTSAEEVLRVIAHQ